MKFDDDIKKKHDLRTIEGKRNAEREQFARWGKYHRSSMSGVEKLFLFLRATANRVVIAVKWSLIIIFALIILRP